MTQKKITSDQLEITHVNGVVIGDSDYILFDPTSTGSGDNVASINVATSTTEGSHLDLSAGDSSGPGDGNYYGGGDVRLYGGNSNVTDGVGGNISVYPGTGGYTNGTFNIHKDATKHIKVAVPGTITGNYRTATFPDATGNIVIDSATQTLTNKRINPRNSGTSGSVSVNSDNFDFYYVNGAFAAITINAPTGTPVEGQKLMLRIKDNGTARTITWNAIYRGIGSTLPTTTVASKTTYCGLVYNAIDTKWDVFTSQEP